MTFEEYKTKTGTTAIYPKEQALGYCYLGLIGEYAEFDDKFIDFSKLVVDYSNSKEPAMDHDDVYNELVLLTGEAGDVMWYVARLCVELDIDLDFDAIEARVLKIKTSDYNVALDASVGFLASTFTSITSASNDLKKIIRDGNDSKYEQRKVKILDTLNRTVESLIFILNVVRSVVDKMDELKIKTTDDLGDDWHSIHNIMRLNIDKLTSRKERGVLKGDGDKR